MVIIYIEQDEYIGTLTQTPGIRLLIHPSGYYPFPEDGGTDVGVGIVNSVRLRRVGTKRVKSDYRSCFKWLPQQLYFLLYRFINNSLY